MQGPGDTVCRMDVSTVPGGKARSSETGLRAGGEIEHGDGGWGGPSRMDGSK